MTKDPICGKEVDPLRARAVGIFGGVTYYFCSQDCKARFVDPRRAPREPTREISSRPFKVTPPVEPVAPSPVAVATPPKISEPENTVDDEDERDDSADDASEVAVKKDPSPSVLEDLKAAQPGWNRVWIVIAVLLVAAGAVLFYLYRRG